MADEIARLSVNLPPVDMDAIRDYARRKGVSKTEAVRRALALLRYVDQAQERGAAINVAENGQMKEVQFLV